MGALDQLLEPPPDRRRTPGNGAVQRGLDPAPDLRGQVPLRMVDPDSSVGNSPVWRDRAIAHASGSASSRAVASSSATVTSSEIVTRGVLPRCGRKSRR